MQSKNNWWGMQSMVLCHASKKTSYHHCRPSEHVLVSMLYYVGWFLCCNDVGGLNIPSSPLLSILPLQNKNPYGTCPILHDDNENGDRIARTATCSQKAIRRPWESPRLRYCVVVESRESGRVRDHNRESHVTR